MRRTRRKEKGKTERRNEEECRTGLSSRRSEMEALRPHLVWGSGARSDKGPKQSEGSLFPSFLQSLLLPPLLSVCDSKLGRKKMAQT